jgi:aminotransferase
VNLAQGFPDFEAPVELKEAATRAIHAGHNQYAVTWGVKALRDAIAAKYARTYGLDLDPEREITVVCGSTEGMIASLMATTDPDDEIIIFEPFYENYGPDADLCGARRVYVRLHAPDWRFDPDELRRAFSPRTRGIIVNSPHNPTGKVFSRQELELIAELCQRHDALCFTDEIYEHITYDGAVHTPMATIEGMRERTVLVNSMSKTYSVTGWRVGWVIAPPALTGDIRKVHDFLTVGAAAPLQHAGAEALALPPDYYLKLVQDYSSRRDKLMAILEDAGLPCWKPAGAYYLLCDVTDRGFATDVDFCYNLLENHRVATVPGSSFFHRKSTQELFIRFCFCKKYETLELAGALLSQRR